MGIVEQVNAVIWSWSETMKALSKRAALLPFLVYAAAQVGLLLLVVGFAYPPISYLMLPLLKWRFGEAVVHYPTNFVALRSALGEGDPILAIFLGAVTMAAAVLLFAAFYERRERSFVKAWKAAASRYWSLVVIAFLIVVLGQVVTRTAFSIFGVLADENAMMFRAVRMVTVALVLLVQAIFAYAVPYVILRGRTLGSALVGGVALTARSPVTTFLIVAVPAALELLPVWLWKQSSVIARTFSPEILAVVMLIWIALLVLAGYITIGSVTRMFLHLTQDEHGVGTQAEGAR